MEHALSCFPLGVKNLDHVIGGGHQRPKDFAVGSGSNAFRECYRPTSRGGIASRSPHYPTIRAAIQDANDGDETVIASGLYRGEANRDLDFEGRETRFVSLPLPIRRSLRRQ